MAIPVILFDLDNTLTHRQQSLKQYAICLATDFRHQLHPCSHDATYHHLISADAGGYLPQNSPYPSVKAARAATLLQHLPWTSRPSLDTLIAHQRLHFPACAVPMPGLYEVFAALKHAHWRIGVVSNGAQESRHRTIDGLHLWKHLDVVISSGGVGIKKPDSRIFTLALHRLHSESSIAWFVGDHPLNDVIGAQRAGLRAIWLTGFHDWPAHLPKPQWKIAQLREILDILPGFSEAGYWRNDVGASCKRDCIPDENEENLI